MRNTPSVKYWHTHVCYLFFCSYNAFPPVLPVVCLFMPQGDFSQKAAARNPGNTRPPISSYSCISNLLLSSTRRISFSDCNIIMSIHMGTHRRQFCGFALSSVIVLYLTMNYSRFHIAWGHYSVRYSLKGIWGFSNLWCRGSIKRLIYYDMKAQ